MTMVHLCADCLGPRNSTELDVRVQCPRCGGWHRILVRPTAARAAAAYLKSHDDLRALKKLGVLDDLD